MPFNIQTQRGPWDDAYNMYSRSGVNAREGVAHSKGELARAIGGRDYWEQFQSQRFLKLSQDYAQPRTPAAPQVLSGRRRGVGTSGVEGAYGDVQAPGAGPAGGDLMSGYRKAFEGASLTQPGMVDPESLSVRGREQLRNVAFEQFFAPQLSGQQEQSMMGVSKLAISRGLRGKATTGTALSMGERFRAGNRRAALDFITSDIKQSQRHFAEQNMDPGGRLQSTEVELHRLLAKSAAFRMLSSGRREFGRAAGLGDENRMAAGQALGPGLMGDLALASQYAGKSIPGMSEQGISQNLQRTGREAPTMGTADLFQGSMPVGMRQYFDLARRETGARAGGGTTPAGGQRGRARGMLDFITGALERDLFSEGSAASAGDIVSGALESQLGQRAGSAGVGDVDFRRLFGSTFGVSGAGSPGEYANILQLQQGARSAGGPGGGPGPSWMSPELHALRTGTGSQRDIQEKMGFIQSRMARNMDAAGRPFMNQNALYNSYNAQMNALRSGSEYLTDVRSRYLSPLSL